ncbi:hypothetical protein [Streptomyces sp. NPDC091416]|uniref:hypothetical protein n=1 Tax=Streptomyces sp. NPDC091416 TaxID=3366003 RepID=UPI003811EC16
MPNNHADRNPAAQIEFLYLSADRVEVHDLAWFCDHWSRESSYSRWRRIPPANLLLLESGSTSPELFTVSGGRSEGFTHLDGRRLARRRGTITSAPQYPDAAPAHYSFDYGEHDPAEDEAPVADVEELRFPACEVPSGDRTGIPES